MSKVLTSLERELELPVKKTDLRENEEVVATDAPFGMLCVRKYNRISILKDIETDKKQTNVVCLPSFEDYLEQKEIRKKIIMNAIEKQS